MSDVGLRMMGKDPEGDARGVEVTDQGAVKTQLTGSYVEVVNLRNLSIPGGGNKRIIDRTDNQTQNKIKPFLAFSVLVESSTNHDYSLNNHAVFFNQTFSQLPYPELHKAPRYRSYIFNVNRLSEFVQMNLQNDSSEERTYDVSIFGLKERFNLENKIYGLSTDDKPIDKSIGTTFFEMDTTKVYIWDGKDWRAI